MEWGSFFLCLDSVVGSDWRRMNVIAYWPLVLVGDLQLSRWRISLEAHAFSMHIGQKHGPRDQERLRNIPDCSSFEDSPGTFQKREREDNDDFSQKVPFNF